MPAIILPPPEPPQWALDAGLPKPTPGEDFVAYCYRLGWSDATVAWLVKGLTTRTAPCINTRLHTQLTRAMPNQWEAHKEARYQAARPSTAQ